MSYLKEENGWNQRRITRLATKRWGVPEAPAILKVERRHVRLRREIRFLRALVREIRVYRPGLFRDKLGLSPGRHLFRMDISSHRICIQGIIWHRGVSPRDKCPVRGYRPVTETFHLTCICSQGRPHLKAQGRRADRPIPVIQAASNHRANPKA
jgi:hypothetical protein